MPGEVRDGIRYLRSHEGTTLETGGNNGASILSPPCPVLMPSLSACPGTAQLPSHTRSCRPGFPTRAVPSTVTCLRPAIQRAAPRELWHLNRLDDGGSSARILLPDCYPNCGQHWKRVARVGKRDGSFRI
jgi:hypothetical protein